MASLPTTLRAFLFDMDGVLTDTARVHSGAWKQMFDEFLATLAGSATPDAVPEAYRPFDERIDYANYVDGKPRYDGVRSFLASRGIALPEGTDADPPSAATVRGLGNRKNELVQRLIREQGVDVYADAVAFVRRVRERGFPCAVVSSSANTETVLAAAGIRDLFATVVDGRSLEPRGLRGKPAPDTYIAAAQDLGCTVEQSAVFEDALAGVASGRAGGFGWVVGVDRVGQAAALRANGADVVIEDFAELSFAEPHPIQARGTRA